jgi:hypothetical protein
MRELFNTGENGERIDWSIGNPQRKTDGSLKPQDEIKDDFLRHFGWTQAEHQEIFVQPTRLSVQPLFEHVAHPTEEHRQMMRDLCSGNPKLNPDTGYPDCIDLPPHQRIYFQMHED